MMRNEHEVWLQITAGQGPVECAWAVAQVIEKICGEALALGWNIRTLALEPGAEAGTAYSALLAASGGPGLDAFAETWSGTVQWIARSPFRPEHKRKNWFVGVTILAPVEETQFDLGSVRWETMRASGPGGQHVNRTESAVRVTHLPTGIQATAAEERSQHRNRKLALARLASKIASHLDEQQNRRNQERWRAHRELERGNPVRVLRAND